MYKQKHVQPLLNGMRERAGGGGGQHVVPFTILRILLGLAGCDCLTTLGYAASPVVVLVLGEN